MHIHIDRHWVSDYPITMWVAATFSLTIRWIQDVSISYCDDYFLSFFFSSSVWMMRTFCVWLLPSIMTDFTSIHQYCLLYHRIHVFKGKIIFNLYITYDWDVKVNDYLNRWLLSCKFSSEAIFHLLNNKLNSSAFFYHF